MPPPFSIPGPINHHGPSTHPHARVNHIHRPISAEDPPADPIQRKKRQALGAAIQAVRDHTKPPQDLEDKPHEAAHQADPTVTLTIEEVKRILVPARDPADISPDMLKEILRDRVGTPGPRTVDGLMCGCGCG
jgi:hypothetical protein